MGVWPGEEQRLAAVVGPPDPIRAAAGAVADSDDFADPYLAQELARGDYHQVADFRFHGSSGSTLSDVGLITM